jgi:hypothetical protein
MIDRVFLVGPSTALDLEPLRGNEKTNIGGSPNSQEPHGLGWASPFPPKTPSGEYRPWSPRAGVFSYAAVDGPVTNAGLRLPASDAHPTYASSTASPAGGRRAGLLFGAMIEFAIPLNVVEILGRSFCAASC